MPELKPTSKHIQIRTGSHPQPDLRLIRILDRVSEPRGASCNFSHPLTTVLFITIVCALCGADEWDHIVLQANGMIGWLGQYVDMTQGVPSARTFKRVFASLAPNQIEAMLRNVAAFVREAVPRELVNFDGKALRGTTQNEQGHKLIQSLNAWSHDNGICIGQIAINAKSNEIPALRQLIAFLDLNGAIVTADALHTQKKSVKAIVEAGADYVLPLKGNQATLLREVEALFSEADATNFQGMEVSSYETLQKSHGREELRQYYSMNGMGLTGKQDWAHLRSIGMVIRERTAREQTSREICFYISSCEVDAQLLARATRGHWGIENGLHWVLDITFREDKLRYRDKVGAANLACIRKLALNALAKEKTVKVGKAGKRLLAATDPVYRDKVLKLLF